MEITGGARYQGCVISNLIKPDERYPLGKEFIGYDLQGKKIYIVTDAKGENRKLPPPIIESMDIDTDGGNNTLKTARLEIRIFSQKQLQSFLFYFYNQYSLTYCIFYQQTNIEKHFCLQFRGFPLLCFQNHEMFLYS